MLHYSHLEKKNDSTLDILLVEDNPGDVLLIRNSMTDCGEFARLHHVKDGVAALDFLYQKNNFKDAVRPHLILLDLNLPKKDGREILAKIKNDPNLKRIPVLILTISQSEDDINECYDLHANAYLTKPLELEKLNELIKNIWQFWCKSVKLPP